MTRTPAEILTFTGNPWLDLAIGLVTALVVAVVWFSWSKIRTPPSVDR